MGSDIVTFLEHAQRSTTDHLFVHQKQFGGDGFPLQQACVFPSHRAVRGNQARSVETMCRAITGRPASYLICLLFIGSCVILTAALCDSSCT